MTARYRLPYLSKWPMRLSLLAHRGGCSFVDILPLISLVQDVRRK